jgi:hypothetical protein
MRSLGIGQVQLHMLRRKRFTSPALLDPGAYRAGSREVFLSHVKNME